MLLWFAIAELFVLAIEVALKFTCPTNGFKANIFVAFVAFLASTAFLVLTEHAVKSPPVASPGAPTDTERKALWCAKAQRTRYAVYNAILLFAFAIVPFHRWPTLSALLISALMLAELVAIANADDEDAYGKRSKKAFSALGSRLDTFVIVLAVAIIGGCAWCDFDVPGLVEHGGSYAERKIAQSEAEEARSKPIVDWKKVFGTKDSASARSGLDPADPLTGDQNIILHDPVAPRATAPAPQADRPAASVGSSRHTVYVIGYRAPLDIHAAYVRSVRISDDSSIQVRSSHAISMTILFSQCGSANDLTLESGAATPMNGFYDVKGTWRQGSARGIFRASISPQEGVHFNLYSADNFDSKIGDIVVR